MTPKSTIPAILALLLTSITISVFGAEYIQDYSQYFEDENGCYIYPVKPLVLPDELELLHHYHDGPVIENYEENNYPADDSYNIDDFEELPFKARDLITALKKGRLGIIEFLLTNPPSLY